MKKVRRQMTEIDRDNLHLTAMLEDLHVSVSERRNIQDTHIQVIVHFIKIFRRILMTFVKSHF